jgi:hypothetical protein
MSPASNPKLPGRTPAVPLRRTAALPHSSPRGSASPARPPIATFPAPPFPLDLPQSLLELTLTATGEQGQERVARPQPLHGDAAGASGTTSTQRSCSCSVRCLSASHQIRTRNLVRVSCSTIFSTVSPYLDSRSLEFLYSCPVICSV